MRCASLAPTSMCYPSMVDKRKQGRKYYRPSQAAPQGDQPLRHYLNRELQNIMSAINCDSELNDERDEDCYCIELCDEVTIGNPVEGGCLEWTTSETTVTLSDFWVGTGGGANFGNRIAADTQIVVEDDTIYIYDGSDIEYTTNYGTNWTRETYLNWLVTDQYWSDNEKTTPSWPSGGWPNGQPINTFSLEAWKMVDGELFACHYEPNNDIAYVANHTTQQVVRCGYGYNALAETNALKENFKGGSWSPVRDLRSFTFGPSGLTTIATTPDQSGGSYPWRFSMLNATDPDQVSQTPVTNAVQVDTGQGYAIRVEYLNDNYLWYGSWAPNGPNALNEYYGIIEGDIKTGESGGEFYYLPTAWNGSSWYPNGTWTEQPTKSSNVLADNTGAYILTPKQRPSKWLENSPEYMFAGLDQNRYGSTWSTPTDGVKRDYSALWHYASQHIFEVIPIKNKGAFMSVEVNASDRTQVAFRISKDAEIASFSTVVTGVFTVEPNGSNPSITVDYSEKNAQFLITYYDLNGQVHVVTFDDVFVCELYEEVGGNLPEGATGLKQNDILEYIEAEGTPQRACSHSSVPCSQLISLITSLLNLELN